MHPKKNFIISVAGGSGSGKTYFAKALHEKLGPSLSTLVYQDSYYKDQSHLFDKDGGQVNFDEPNAIDFTLLAKQLASLQSNNKIEAPIYDFKTHKRKQYTQTIIPRPIIIVDGILLLQSEQVRKVSNLNLFVQTNESIRLQRRLKRDTIERGRTVEGVMEQFSKQVKPMHDQHVEPSKKFSHDIINGEDPVAFQQKLEQILHQIKLSKRIQITMPEYVTKKL